MYGFWSLHFTPKCLFLHREALTFVSKDECAQCNSARKCTLQQCSWCLNLKHLYLCMCVCVCVCVCQCVSMCVCVCVCVCVWMNLLLLLTGEINRSPIHYMYWRFWINTLMTFSLGYLWTNWVTSPLIPFCLKKTKNKNKKQTCFHIAWT